ncbi:MAG: helix-turn-helix transcriptional regulator [Defluviitaleaceae bacterium]|nr:helix-turn-helix transcriptional regulator [Defluviitaleaceae bacterium]MCL2239890.1 helix-turn-helix transcriptional regulator [Defluviitaleaceae bacterium]
MNYTALGKMIKQLRSQKKISQKKLAQGIMGHNNLSRIEKGQQSVSKEKLDMIFNRLGHVATRFFPYPLTEGEFAVYELRDAFNNAQAKSDVDKMASLIKDMEKLPEFQVGLHKQSLLRDKACLLLYQDTPDAIAAKQLLYEAIKISIPEFEINNINTYLLGGDDQEIIAMLAEIAYDAGEGHEAVIILEKLAQNIRKRMSDSYEKARALTFVLYNLSKYLGKMGQYQKALDVCNEAIEAGEEYQAYGNLPSLKFNKAYCYHFLNKNNNEIEPLLYQAYFTALGLGRHVLAGEILRYADTVLNIKIKTFPT